MRPIVVAKALVLDENGDALLLRRSATHPTLPHEPDFPGGEVERGEEIAKALAREIFEETGLRVEANNARLLFAGTEVRFGDSYTRLLFVVKLTSKKPEVTLSWEHDGFEWIAPEAIPNLEEKFNSFAKDALAHIHKYNLLEA